MKKLLWVLAIFGVLLVAGVFAFRLASPEIRVENRSAALISEVVVQLPSSGVSFGPIQPHADSTIYYSASQDMGRYAYTVRLEGAEDRQGACGQVVPSDFGKRLRLIVHSPDNIECRENNKVF
jgi:hypothetical protein